MSARAREPQLRGAAFVVAALVLALSVRAAFVLATPHFHPVNDPFDYQRIATSVAAGHGFGRSVVAPGDGPSAFRPPLYPLSLGAFYKVAGIHVQAARLAQAVLGAATAGLVGLLCLQLFGRRTGAVALVIAAVYPPLVLDGGSLLSESLSVPLELGALCAALHAPRSSKPWPWIVVTGMFAGLGILNRPNTALLVIPFAMLVRPGRGNRWQKVAPTAAVVALAALVLVPWLVRDERAFHHFVPLTTQAGLVSAGTYNPQADHDPSFPAAFRPVNLVPEYAAVLRAHSAMGEIEEDQRFRTLAWRYVEHHPLYPLKVAFWNTVRLFDLSGPAVAHLAARAIGYHAGAADVGLYSYYVAGALAAAGAVVCRPFSRNRAVWLVPVLIVVSTVFLQGETRLRAGIEPFVILLDALALERLTRLRRTRPT